MADLMVSIGASTDALQKALDGASQKLATFADKTKDIGKKMEKMGTQLSLKLTAPLTVLGGLVVKTAADFETLNVALKTTFQGNEQAAASAFKQIQEFAAKTPFQVEQVASAFIKLKNYGLDPSERALMAYGDTASAMGKSLDQMIEAVADAATGQFERLKEFGIKAQSEGDRVTFTFRGVSTEVGKNAAEIEEYLMQLGEVNFAGGMEAQSKTFSGRLSTLKDNIAQVSDSFGKIIIEAINPFIDKIGNLAKAMNELSPNTKKVIVVIGALLAALGPLLATIGFFTTTILPGLSVALGAASTAVGFLTSAFTALNAIIIANPITAIATAFVAAAAAVTSFVQAITPAVSKLRTFFNILISGGNSAVFINKQLQDQAKGMRDLEGDTKGANKELSEYASWLDQTNKFAFSKKPTIPTVKIPTTPTVKEKRKKVEKLPTEQIGLTDAFMNIPQKLAMANEGIRMEMRKAADILTEFDLAATEIIGGSIANTFMMLGDAIGRAFAEGGNVLKAATNALMAGLGGLLSAMGDYLIQAGTAAVLAGTVMKLFGTVSGIGAGLAAIAGGVLLKAVGGAFGSFGNKMSDVSTGSTSGSGSRDYSSGGSTVSRSSMSNGDGTVVFEIAGTKLIGVLNRTLSSNRALGGQISING